MSRLPVRWFNAAARVVGRRRPFAEREEAFLDRARAKAGRDDFGDPGFREGLRVLLRAYDEESRLNPFGRWMSEQVLLGALAARLAVVAQWKAQPEMLERPIERPLVILGLPRTGTTALHHLLAQDPANQVLEYWLGTSPGPRPPRETWARDPRYKPVSQGLALSYWLDPRLRAIHDLSADGPDECRHLLLQCFSDDTYDSNATIPSYTAWYRRCDMRPAYAWHRDCLKLIGATSPPERRWVLKYPAHMAHLHVLLETYPDACVVQTHRDPAEVLPSLCSLVTHWRGIYEDEVDRPRVAAWQVELWATRIAHALAVRDRGDPARFLDLDFRQIRDDPAGAVRRIYTHFGRALSDEAAGRIEAWARTNPQGRHGGHRYAAEDFGLDPGALRERFAFYTERFPTG